MEVEELEFGELPCLVLGANGLIDYGYGFDGCDSLADDVEFFGGGHGQVDDGSFAEGSSVGYAHDDGFSVAGVGNAEERTEGEGAVGAGHAVFIVGLAAAGAPSVPAVAVVGGIAGELLGEGLQGACKAQEEGGNDEG